MPATPIYIHRLAEGIAALEAFQSDLIDRRTLEEALGVGKWTAWRIMRHCGAVDGPGKALVCRRAELIARLRKLEQDRRFEPEIQRRRKLETNLDSMLRFAARKHKQIVRDHAAEALVSSRFKSLPEGVELTPGELRIRFTTPEDFLQKFGAVVFALHNDYEAIAEFIASGQ
jgi:hypothetical protein